MFAYLFANQPVSTVYSKLLFLLLLANINDEKPNLGLLALPLCSLLRFWPRLLPRASWLFCRGVRVTVLTRRELPRWTCADVADEQCGCASATSHVSFLLNLRLDRTNSVWRLRGVQLGHSSWSAHPLNAPHRALRRLWRACRPRQVSTLLAPEHGAEIISAALSLRTRSSCIKTVPSMASHSDRPGEDRMQHSR